MTRFVSGSQALCSGHASAFDPMTAAATMRHVGMVSQETGTRLRLSCSRARRDFHPAMSDSSLLVVERYSSANQ